VVSSHVWIINSIYVYRHPQTEQGFTDCIRIVGNTFSAPRNWRFHRNKTIKTIAGIEGISGGLSAIYACVTKILNDVYGKTILPLGKV
jgi:hypothetical protein